MQILDKFGKTIEVNHIVVYPSRPGGKGPLQLVSAKVTSVEHGLGELTVVPTGEHERPVAIKRTDRVAIVQP